MKTHLIFALAGLAISLASSTFSQQANTPDPQLRQKVLEMAKNFEEAWNNNDASTLAALFTEDAVLVNDSGPVYGREAIKKYYTDLFQNVLITWMLCSTPLRRSSLILSMSRSSGSILLH
jgi:hypothetical protein